MCFSLMILIRSSPGNKAEHFLEYPEISQKMLLPGTLNAKDNDQMEKGISFAEQNLKPPVSGPLLNN